MIDAPNPATLAALGWLDLGVHLAGGGVLVGFAAHLLLTGKWRDPLAVPAARGATGPTLVHLVLVIATYACGAMVLSEIVLLARQRLGAGQADATVGTAWWHLLLFVEHFAKLCATLMAVYFITPSDRGAGQETPRDWSAGEERRAPLWPRIAWVAGCVTALLAITTLQHHGTIVVLQWLIPAWRPPEHPVLAALARDPLPPWGAAHLAFQATLVAGICEEVFFRGLLLGVAWRLLGSAWLAIALSAVAFGLVHVGVPQSVLPLTTMGLVLGYVRIRTGSVWICVIAHVLFNARTIALAILAPERLAP